MVEDIVEISKSKMAVRWNTEYPSSSPTYPPKGDVK